MTTRNEEAAPVLLPADLHLPRRRGPVARVAIGTIKVTWWTVRGILLVVLATLEGPVNLLLRLLSVLGLLSVVVAFLAAPPDIRMTMVIASGVIALGATALRYAYTGAVRALER
jgi:hypothetical protein